MSRFLIVPFEIFNFLDKSDDFEHFLKNSIFENFLKIFLQVFWPILYGKKLMLWFSIFWTNQVIMNTFKNLSSEKKLFSTLCTVKKTFSSLNFNFWKSAQNHLIYTENWKSQNKFFPIQNGSKIFKNGIFQKMLNFSKNAQNHLIHPEYWKS